MPTTTEVNTSATNFIADADTFDAKVNGSPGLVTDRHGNVTSNTELILQTIGYEPAVDFVSGLSITKARQQVFYNGILYSANPSQIPFTTTSSFDETEWVPRGVVSDLFLLPTAYGAQGNGVHDDTIDPLMDAVTDMAHGNAYDPSALVTM